MAYPPAGVADGTVTVVDRSDTGWEDDGPVSHGRERFLGALLAGIEGAAAALSSRRPDRGRLRARRDGTDRPRLPGTTPGEYLTPEYDLLVSPVATDGAGDGVAFPDLSHAGYHVIEMAE